MKELSATEIEQVGGGFFPALYGVLYGAGMLASSTIVRTGVTWAAQGIVGGTAFALAQEVYSNS